MKRKSLISSRASLCLFLLAFVSYALVYMTKNCYSAAMASIVDEGIMTKSQTGLIAALFYLVYAPFQIVGGMAADRYSPGKLVTIGVFGAGICNLLIYFFSESYIAMMIIWSLNAVLQFGIWPSIFKIVTTQLVEEHRVKGMFYISMSSTFGLLISYISAMFITNWKNNFMLSAITMLILGFGFFFIYRALEKKMVDDEPPARKKTVYEKKEKFLPLILRAGIPLLLLVYMVHSMLNLGIKAITPVMLMESYETISPAMANGLNTILVIASPVGILFARNRFFRKFSAPTIIASFLAITLPLLFIVTLIGSIPVFVMLCALAILMIILAATSIFFSSVSMYFDRFGYVATLSGLLNCMASLGIVLANYVFAKIAELKGWEFTTTCWLVITASAFLLTVAVIPLWKRFVKKTQVKK